MKTIQALVLTLLLSVIALFPSAEAQQKPSPVAIWCQDGSGNFAPCQSGPAGFASADNIANQTASIIHGFGFMFDGSTWDRLRGDSTNGLLVNLGANNDVTVTSGTVAATQSGAWNVTNISGTVSLPTGAATAALQDGIIKDGTGDTTQANVSSGSLHVACQSGCSGGTQYAEDTAHVSGDTVTMAGVVRQDSDAAVSADGDRSVLQVDATGFLKVINKSPNLAADDSTNSTAKSPVLAARANTSAPTWTDGRQVPLSVDTSGALRVTGASGATQYAEDTTSTDGESLMMAGTVRRDTPASSTATSTDRATLNTDRLGRLWVHEANVCADESRITHAVINESTAATNEIVALSANALIYVCSYKFVTTAANSLNWVHGTGTDCGTGKTSIEGPQAYGANGGATESGGGHALFVVPASNALCLTSSAATQHGGRVSYVRTTGP